MKVEAIEVLKKVKARLSVLSRWTHEHVARDTSGAPVYAEDPKAVCWCLMGATHKETFDAGFDGLEACDLRGEVYEALRATRPDPEVGGIGDVQDLLYATCHGHGALLDWIDCAIVKLEQGGSDNE